jgi:arsenite methyltransferase
VSTTNIRKIVKEKYGEAALRVASGQANACCGGSSACGTDIDPITANLYGDSEKGVVPEEAVLASLGCGNPTALAELREGETVLDLGSGGGIDVLLSARRVGPTGKAYGLDMTGEMLALARANQKKAGVENVEFLQGEIESIPLPDNSVDVVISNCVINLSSDKDRVLREAFRVLRPGGRLAVSDVVVRGDVPRVVREHMLLWWDVSRARSRTRTISPSSPRRVSRTSISSRRVCMRLRTPARSCRPKASTWTRSRRKCKASS